MREAIVSRLSSLTSPHGKEKPYGCEAVLLKSHCSCHNGLPRKAMLVPRSLPWTSVSLADSHRNPLCRFPLDFVGQPAEGKGLGVC